MQHGKLTSQSSSQATIEILGAWKRDMLTKWQMPRCYHVRNTRGEKTEPKKNPRRNNPSVDTPTRATRQGSQYTILGEKQKKTKTVSVEEMDLDAICESCTCIYDILVIQQFIKHQYYW